MAFSEIEHARLARRLRNYCETRIPLHARSRLRLGFRIKGHHVVLFEERPAFRPPHDWRESPVAKFTYVRTRRLWRLFCQHRDLRWHAYQRLPAAGQFELLLQEADADGMTLDCLLMTERPANQRRRFALTARLSSTLAHARVPAASSGTGKEGLP